MSKVLMLAIKGLQKNNKGFGGVIVILTLLVIAIVGVIEYYTLHRDSVPHNRQESTAKAKQGQSNQPADPYQGWETATPPRAGFTIKYPPTWKYSETIGTKDGVEHLVLDSDKFHLAIDSYTRDGLGASGQTDMKCPDCDRTIKETPFTAQGLGKVNLDTVTYRLDAGKGNAIIVRQPDGTYYLPSPLKAGVVSSFRGISMQPSLEAYQAETTSDFTQNSDYVTAQEILKSLTY